MKKLICMLSCLMLYSLSCAVDYFHDEFEWTDYTGIWGNKTEQDVNTIDTSATVAKMGAQSLKITDGSAIADDLAYLSKTFSPGISTDMYIRFYYYLPTGAVATLGGGHGFAYVTTSSNFRFWIAWAGSQYLHNNNGIPNWDGAIDTEAVWHNYEVHLGVPSASAIGEMWLDGTKCPESMTSAISGQTYSAMRFGYGDNLWDGTGTGVYYLDELIVSDARIQDRSFVVDTTSPSAPGTVNDGTGTDISSTFSTSQLSANWTAATDSESGIAKYQYAIGTTAGGTETLTWTDNSPATAITVTRTGLTLTAQTYYFSVRAVNGAGFTGPAANSNGQAVTADTTPPSAPAAVRDGTGTTDSANTTSTTQLSANWDAATDSESAITAYQYAIGTTAGGTDIANWATLGNVLTVTKTGLSLTAGQTCYFSVRAVSAGGTGNAANSNGQLVPTTPPPPTTNQNVYPNPCSFVSGTAMTFKLTGTAGGTVKIYTLDRILVRTLSVSSGDVTWDGKDTSGQNVESGVYIYTAAGSTKTKGKIIVLR